MRCEFWWIYDDKKNIQKFGIYFSNLFHGLFMSGNVEYIFIQIFVQIHFWNFSFLEIENFDGNTQII